MHTGAEIDLKLKKTMKLKTIKEMTAVVAFCTACLKLIREGIKFFNTIKTRFPKKEKEVQPSQQSSRNVKSITLNDIFRWNKGQSAASHHRGLFALGELHVICAQTGMGKSIFAVEMGLAMAGGKESEPYAIVKSILGDKWDATKQRVEYLDGENGEDELYERYGRGDVNYPDTFTVVPSGEISSIDDLEKYIRQRAEESKYREDRTIIIDHPGCYDGSDNPHRMQKFYKSLKSIIVNYRQGGHCLTVFVLSFVNTDKPWKPVYSEDIIGTKELKNIAHTIVALCPCRKGGEYRFLKVVKSRSGEKNEEVPVLKISKEGGLFLHFVGRMNEKDALPLPVKSRKTPVTSPDLEQDIFEVTGTSVASSESVLQDEKPETVEEVTGFAVEPDKRKKVTPGKLQRMKQMYKEGLKQGEIAKALGLCRKTVNKHLQCINREEPQCNLLPLSC